ncbi:hypothetical protein GQ54DRAFT_298608 [Martensiomyces pterosporus]|nr:hypothetical protein GQ54DRAFT_298608 [Martensiomyces pterosporus]
MGAAASAYWSTAKLKKFKGKSTRHFIEEFEFKMTAQGIEEDRYTYYLRSYLRSGDKLILKCIKRNVGKGGRWADIREAFISNYSDDDDDEEMSEDDIKYQAIKLHAVKPSRQTEKSHVRTVIAVLGAIKTWPDMEKVKHLIAALRRPTRDAIRMSGRKWTTYEDLVPIVRECLGKDRRAHEMLFKPRKVRYQGESETSSSECSLYTSSDDESSGSEADDSIAHRKHRSKKHLKTRVKKKYKSRPEDIAKAEGGTKSGVADSHGAFKSTAIATPAPVTQDQQPLSTIDDLAEQMAAMSLKIASLERSRMERARPIRCFYCSGKHRIASCGLLEEDISKGRAKMVDGRVCFPDGRLVPFCQRGHANIRGQILDAVPSATPSTSDHHTAATGRQSENQAEMAGRAKKPGSAYKYQAPVEQLANARKEAFEACKGAMVTLPVETILAISPMIRQDMKKLTTRKRLEVGSESQADGALIRQAEVCIEIPHGLGDKAPIEESSIEVYQMKCLRC